MRLSRNTLCQFALAVLLVALSGSWAGNWALADEASAAKENELIKILQTGPPAEKAITCKQLAIYGSKQCVPELAKLLADEQLASWARIALEAIPDQAADEALRQALPALKGRLAVGTINSLGVRRDAAAVEPLTGRLQDADADVASAAAVALGRVGNAPATKTLRQALAGAPASVRSAVAEGLILCAERRIADGQGAEAAAIYDEVRKAEVPKPRKLEATRGAILARKTDGIPLLLEQINSADRDLMRIGLSAARELAGREVADALAAELARTTPDRATLLLYAMADRTDAVVSPAVLSAAEKGDPQVRIAAISVIGRSGDAGSVATLLTSATDANADVSQAAKNALVELHGDKINAEIAARLQQAEGRPLSVLLEIVGQRRIEATPALIKALDQADPAVRSAALAALGETVALKDLSVLIAQVLTPKNPEDAKVADRALHAACVRMADREACAAELATAMPRASVPTKGTLMTVLGAMGGPKALETIAAAMQGGDDQLQDIGSRLLGEWMTADAAPVLLEQAKTSSAAKYQSRALRAYIRIARQFVLPDKQRAEMCQLAIPVAGRPEEQKLILAVLERYPSLDTLKVAINAVAVPGLKDDAGRTAVVIAQRMGGDSPEARDLLATIGLKAPKVEIVKAEYGSGATQKDVTAALQKQARGAAVINLTAPYNQVFGGDPIPGSPKQLKVQYRIDGKLAEASFPENAPIALPTP